MKRSSSGLQFSRSLLAATRDKMEFVSNGFVNELHSLIEAGDNTPAFSFSKVAKPVSWMGRKELQREKNRLRDKYYKSNNPLVAAKGAIGGGIVGGIPIAAALKLSKSPAVKARIKRLSIPVVGVSALLGALSAPSRSRKSTVRRLVDVDRRLKQTSAANLEAQMYKASASRAGHWRDLPDHWEGKDQNGNPVRGKTWVRATDVGERESKEPPLPVPQLFTREGEYTAYVTPTPGGAVVFGIHDDIDEDFSKLVVAKGKNWASDSDVHNFMAKYEKEGKFSIYSVDQS